MLEDICKKPIIGILAQEVSEPMKKGLEKLGITADSYIAASYVKAVESSGARILPIFLNRSKEYYRKILRSINGVVLPGGNTWFYETDNETPRDDGYPKAAEILYKEIKKINKDDKKGQVFPILGICLGFEVLLFVDNGKSEYRGECDTIQAALPLDFRDLAGDRELGDCPVELFKENVAYFSHRFYVEEEALNKQHLSKKWKVIATTKEEKRNIKYVSIIESKKYPFIGLQFHPEKNAYEWKDKFPIPHDEKAIQASRYFFDWLVKRSRSNNNHFENCDEEERMLINNYTSTFTPNQFSFDEIYFFPQESIL